VNWRELLGRYVIEVAHMKRLAFVCVVFSVCCTSQAFADSIEVGDLEYNNLFAGVNYFTIDNFTGSNNLGFFPVASNVTFFNSVLTLTDPGGGILVFNLGNIGPGANTTALVSSALSFTEADFAATLDPSSFPLTNGDSGTFIADPSLSFTLLPSSGSTLVAGVDLGTINASPASSPVPEPGTVMLLLAALGAALGLPGRNHFLSGKANHGIELKLFPSIKP
jgi:hypothetical protein